MIVAKLVQRAKNVTLTAILLSSLASGAVVPVGRIQLNQTPFEKFGSLFFPFKFNVPQLFVLCEFGVDKTQRTGCKGDVVSDLVSVTNNDFGEGVVSMLSDTEGQFVVPPDFPLPPEGSPIRVLKETGKAQRLTRRDGLATTNPDGTAGPTIRLTATSDLEQHGTISDVLAVATQ